MSKYDAEISKCTEYYSSMCSAMEGCRGQIAASNYIAANSRSLILDAQSTISKCEEQIPTRKLALKQHLLKCKHEVHKMRSRVEVVGRDMPVWVPQSSSVYWVALMQLGISELALWVVTQASVQQFVAMVWLSSTYRKQRKIQMPVTTRIVESAWSLFVNT